MPLRSSARSLVVMWFWLAVCVTSGASAAAQPAASTADLVRIPFPEDDGTLTPYTYETGYSLMTLIYDTLLWRDAEGLPQPWLARSVETSEDGKRVTVSLNDGVQWQDGAPLTAADVAFTFRHIADHQHPRFTAEVAMVERVDAIDPLTAVISLREPVAGFHDQPLADMPILPAHVWSGLAPGQPTPEGLPMGSGPYRLVDHQPGKSYEFEANQDYFKGSPAVRQIVVPIIPAADDTLAALRQGGVDMVPASLPPDRADDLSGLAARVMTGPSYAGTVLMFNLRAAPFDRVEARRAVAQAIDLERLVRAVGDSAAAGKGYLHPASPWASTEELDPFDPNRAREALASLQLPPIEILTPNDDPQRVEAARQVALALERAGLKASSKAISEDELSRAVGEAGAAPTFQAAIWRAPALASYDPGYLHRVFGSDPPAPSLNYSGYSSPAFDALAQRISTTTERNARQDAVNETLKLLASDAPVAPLYFATGTFGIRPGAYDGWVFIKGSGILDKRSFVEPSRGAIATTPQAGPTASQPRPGPSGGGRFPLAYAGLALMVAAAGIGIFVWRRR